jgi:predicted lipid-binding transport protein (Tim44 family)
MTRMTGLLAALILGLITLPAAAAMYKWVDEEGNTHYSQTPPPGRPAETIAAPKAPPAPPRRENVAEEPADGGGETSATEESGPSEAERRRIERENAARCREARQLLQRYETTPRIRVPDGDSFRYLSEEERQQHIRDARKIIQERCK